MIKKIRELCLFNREKIRKQICFDELDNLLFNLRFMQSKSLKEIYPEAPVDERTVRYKFEHMMNRFKNIPSELLVEIFRKN